MRCSDRSGRAIVGSTWRLRDERCPSDNFLDLYRSAQTAVEEMEVEAGEADSFENLVATEMILATRG